LIKDKKRIGHLFPVVMNATRTTTTSASKAATASLEKEVTGIVLCVGTGGIPSIFGTCSLTYSINQRMSDCMDILCKVAVNSSQITNDGPAGAGAAVASNASSLMDPAAARSLLTTLLLTEDEYRLTNTMANAAQRIILSQEDEGGGGLLGTAKRRNVENNILMGDDDENPLHVNSADQARIVVERLAVLSVCEADTLFRKFEGRNKDSASEKGGKKKLRKATKDADLDGFDFRGETRSTPNTISSTASFSSRTSATAISSDASVSLRSTTSNSSNLALKGPKKDTSRLTQRPKQQSVPALSKPNKDFGGRRSSLTDMNSGGKPRNQAGRKPLSSAIASSSTPLQSDGVSLASTGKSSTAGFDPFQEKPFMGQDAAQGNGNGGSFAVGNQRDGASTKVLVNIALNEDLTCFYKLSKMSSCSVEGVVQVQVKSNVDQGVPFFLLIRDPSNHIQSIQENKKFAESMADSLSSEPPSKRPDHMFTVSVPKADNYFPVMRYKCGNELRPVPIVSICLWFWHVLQSTPAQRPSNFVHALVLLLCLIRECKHEYD
jgi:hypothetical protein